MGVRTDGRLSLTAQLHAGRHVIVVRHVSWNLSDGWSFGDDEAPSLNYSISGARDVLDEGTDPWFPARRRSSERAHSFDGRSGSPSSSLPLPSLSFV